MGKSGDLSADTDGRELRRLGDFLFVWGKSSRTITHLGLFLLGSFLLHVLGFYLFQVVYPSTSFLEPVPSKVTLLDETRPAVSSLLREVGDRLVYLRPASLKADARAELSDYSVRFEPSFAGRALEFRPLPEVKSFEGFSGKKEVPVSIVVLPAVDAGPGPERAENRAGDESGFSRWTVRGGLEGREVLNPEQFTEALPELKTAPAVVLSIGVGPEGAVRFVLPRVGGARPDFDGIAAVVKQRMKFEARPGTAIAWGDLVIDR